MIYILQGPPGSGKSTWTKTHAPKAVVCSADAFFVDKKGIYNFDPSLIGSAHASCMRTFIEALVAQKKDIVVDNTNMTLVEMAPYYLGAQAYWHDVAIVRFEVDAKVAAARNIHGVPLASIERMIAARQDPPPWWDVKMLQPTM